MLRLSFLLVTLLTLVAARCSDDESTDQDVSSVKDAPGSESTGASGQEEQDAASTTDPGTFETDGGAPAAVDPDMGVDSPAPGGAGGVPPSSSEEGSTDSVDVEGAAGPADDAPIDSLESDEGLDL
jgi:hypothetical protein